MHSENPIADSVGLSIVLTAALFSPEVAAIVGPYILIATAGVIGASFALARRPTSSRWAAVGFFFRVTGLALILTVGASKILSAFYPSFSERALLAPVALLIGFLDWGAVLGGAGRAFGSALNRTIDNVRPGEPK